MFRPAVFVNRLHQNRPERRWTFDANANANERVIHAVPVPAHLTSSVEEHWKHELSSTKSIACGQSFQESQRPGFKLYAQAAGMGDAW